MTGGTSKAREKRPGDEVVVIFELRHPGPIMSFTSRELCFSKEQVERCIDGPRTTNPISDHT